jgi:hypothetical protein
MGFIKNSESSVFYEYFNSTSLIYFVCIEYNSCNTRVESPVSHFFLSLKILDYRLLLLASITTTSSKHDCDVVYMNQKSGVACALQILPAVYWCFG